MKCLPKTPATKRYTRRLTVAMSAYIVLLFSVTFLFKRYHPVGGTAYLLAILPALPTLAAIAIIGLYLAEEPDEFQRVLLVQSMVWSIGITMSVTTVWGFLELFVGTPHLLPYLVFPMFWFFVGASSPLLKRRYR